MCVQGEEQGACGDPVLRLRAVEMWVPTLTLGEQSDRKSRIHQLMESDSPRPVSLCTSLCGSIVLNAV